MSDEPYKTFLEEKRQLETRIAENIIFNGEQRLRIPIKIKIKKLDPEAVIPKAATDGSVGLDLTATTMARLDAHTVSYGTGLAFEIPPGHFIMLVPRSSIYKKELILSNSCGIIDSDYRGEVRFIFLNGDSEKIYSIGDRIGQAIILPYPKIEFEEVNELSDSDRGTGGFGSSGA